MVLAVPILVAAHYGTKTMYFNASSLELLEHSCVYSSSSQVKNIEYGVLHCSAGSFIFIPGANKYDSIIGRVERDRKVEESELIAYKVSGNQILIVFEKETNLLGLTVQFYHFGHD